jgi:hypothetical protein
VPQTRIPRPESLPVDPQLPVVVSYGSIPQ